MKTSLGHLPEYKRSELGDIISIIQKSAIKPEMIILFGSFARGDWVEDRYQDDSGTTYEYKSDFDIFIVVATQNIVMKIKVGLKNSFFIISTGGRNFALDYLLYCSLITS